MPQIQQKEGLAQGTQNKPEKHYLHAPRTTENNNPGNSDLRN